MFLFEKITLLWESKNMKKKQNSKVVVAISGGKDSAVAAALLKRAGFNVVGVFLKLYNSPHFRRGEKRARKIAKILKIPFLVLDLRKEFKKEIIDYFLREEKRGRTPNPCVICNRKIKLGALLKKALALDADFLATGHYVRLGKSRLFRAKDKKRDQSYFLYQLNQNQLKHLLFPVGDYTKEEVRNLAKKFKLPVLNIPESRDICFIETSPSDFLAKYLKLKPGKIVDSEGRTMGSHQGLFFYTIGQRKNLGLTKGPYYVLDKNVKKNTLIVTKRKKDLYKKELIAENVNWISGKKPSLPLRVRAKIRYSSPLASAVVSRKGKFIKVVFDKAQLAVTPGQSVVFYRAHNALCASVYLNQELLGGGIIS